jgi:DNA polymerase III epsilon subunit family exonuclease
MSTMDQAIYFFDLETTGLLRHNGRIVEIACAKVIYRHVGGGIEIDSTFEEYVNPEIPIPAASAKVHGITDERVANAPKIGEMLLHFKDFCPEGSVLIAHNGDNFDKIVLQNEFKRAGIRVPEYRYADTCKMARTILPYAKSYSLQYLKNWFNIHVTGPAHRALPDVLVMIEVYHKLREGRCNTQMIGLSEQYQIKTMPFGKHKGVLLENLEQEYIHWMLYVSDMFKGGENPDLKKVLLKVLKQKVRSRCKKRKRSNSL